MSYVVRAFPVLEGQEDRVRELARAMAAERSAEAAKFYSAFGVRHESWHLQETPQGLWVIAVSDIDEPDQRAAEYAAATEEFAGWFKQQVLALSGIDPQTQPLGPPTEALFSISAEAPRPVAAAIDLWERFRAGTISEAENIPEAQWDFRPGEGARSVRELAIHVAQAGVGFATELTNGAGSLARLFDESARAEWMAKYPRAESRAEILALLRDTMADGAKLLRTRGEALASDTIKMFGGPTSRLTALQFAMSHEMYHRGQLTTYARGLGHVPILTQQAQSKKR
jgi:uncharacterized damage-inducible protein DinB